MDHDQVCSLLSCIQRIQSCVMGQVFHYELQTMQTVYYLSLCMCNVLLLAQANNFVVFDQFFSTCVGK